MFRLSVAAFVVALASPALAQSPMPPTLKSTITVTSDLVRVGDLVDNAGIAANAAVFRSPDPGSTGIVPVQQVVEALRPYDVVAVNTLGLTDVTVTRTSREIPAKDVEDRILRSIAGHYSFNDPRSVSLTFDRELRPVHVEAGVRGDLQISRMSFDPRTGRFDVTLDVAGSDALRRAPLRLSGVASETFDAATVTRSITRGEILRASDVVVQRRPKTEFTNDTFGEQKAVIGQAAKRQLRAGQTLREGDLVKPDIVARNEPVIILYQVPGIALTVRGKALEAGAQGDMVNVLNVQSQRNIQAVVVAPGRVAVTSLSPQIAASVASISDPAGARRRPE